FNLAVDLTFSAMATLLIYGFKFEVGWLKIDLVRWKGEWKDAGFLMTNTQVKLDANKQEVKSMWGNHNLTKFENSVSGAVTTAATAVTEGVKSAAGGVANFIRGLANHT